MNNPNRRPMSLIEAAEADAIDFSSGSSFYEDVQKAAQQDQQEADDDFYGDDDE